MTDDMEPSVTTEHRDGWTIQCVSYPGPAPLVFPSVIADGLANTEFGEAS